MKFRRRNSEALADLICGNLGSHDPAPGEAPKYFPYRSSMYIEVVPGLVEVEVAVPCPTPAVR